MRTRLAAAVGVIASLAAAMLLLNGGAHAAVQSDVSETIVAVGQGAAAIGDDPAAAEDEAVWDAKRNAVEQAVGVLIRSHTVGRDFTVAEDEIDARTTGFVKRWEIVPGSRIVENTAEGRILRVQVRAVVGLVAMIRTLADIRDVYADLQRPRLSVTVDGGDAGDRCRDAITRSLRAEGFDVVDGPAAEVTIVGIVRVLPTVGLGDPNSPYGVGEVVASSHVRLYVRAFSAASEAVLFAATAEGWGSSFESDVDASERGAEAAASALLNDQRRLFVQHLLARWARERQDGHVVAIEVTGLAAQDRAAVHTAICTMRGFRSMLYEGPEEGRHVYRFLTRLDNRSIRRRLASVQLQRNVLTVANDRGPIVLCAACARPRLSRN